MDSRICTLNSDFWKIANIFNLVFFLISREIQLKLFTLKLKKKSRKELVYEPILCIWFFFSIILLVNVYKEMSIEMLMNHFLLLCLLTWCLKCWIIIFSQKNSKHSYRHFAWNTKIEVERHVCLANIIDFEYGLF